MPVTTAQAEWESAQPPKAPKLSAGEKYLHTELGELRETVERNHSQFKVEFAKLATKKQVDQRFSSADQRFDSMDQRFDSMDQRFDELTKLVESLRGD